MSFIIKLCLVIKLCLSLLTAANDNNENNNNNRNNNNNDNKNLLSHSKDTLHELSFVLFFTLLLFFTHILFFIQTIVTNFFSFKNKLLLVLYPRLATSAFVLHSVSSVYLNQKRHFIPHLEAHTIGYYYLLKLLN